MWRDGAVECAQRIGNIRLSPTPPHDRGFRDLPLRNHAERALSDYFATSTVIARRAFTIWCCAKSKSRCRTVLDTRPATRASGRHPRLIADAAQETARVRPLGLSTANAMDRPIRRALLSVSDKTESSSSPARLPRLKWSCFPGGTARSLAQAGIAVREVAESPDSRRSWTDASDPASEDPRRPAWPARHR